MNNVNSVNKDLRPISVHPVHIVKLADKWIIQGNHFTVKSSKTVFVVLPRFIEVL